MNTVTITHADQVKSILFVSKAIAGKKDLRIHLQHLYVDDTRIIATDGNRLHLVNREDFPDMENGYYAPVKQGKNILLVPAAEQAITYPNIDQVIPQEHSISIDLTKGKDDNLYTSIIMFTVFNANKSLLNHNYVEDITSIDNWTVKMSDQASSPILFANCIHKAVIMPFCTTLPELPKKEDI